MSFLCEGVWVLNLLGRGDEEGLRHRGSIMITLVGMIGPVRI